MRLIVRGVLWFGLYMAIVLFPLLAVAVSLSTSNPASPLVNLAAACGYIGLALMASELALVSRFEGAAGAFGLDSLLQFHRLMGILAMAFVIAHPLLLIADRTYSVGLLIPSATMPWPVLIGTTAFVVALLVVGLSLLRKQLRISYEVWQVSHGVLSIVLIAFATAHVFGIGRYATLPVVRVIWAVYLVAFVGMFLRYRLLRPLSLMHRPWEVVLNRPERGQAHTLVLRPVGHEGFRFEPGQFGWIGFGKTPFAVSQHPISFSSNGDVPCHDGAVSFTIKQLGDWSSEVVPQVKPGTRAWIDGPYGVFTIDREEGAGYVLIGGGVGITPLYSMLQALEYRGDVRPSYVFHGANDIQDATFHEQLEAMARRMENLTLVTVLLKAEDDWEGECGFITAEILAYHLPAALYRRFQYLICGPAPLMDAMEKVLPQIGVPADRIHTERFDMV